MTDEIKRLYRSRVERKIAGLCAGIGLYFRFDPTFVRIACIAITLMTGVAPGIVAYLICWFVVPLEPLPAVAQRVDHSAASPA